MNGYQPNQDSQSAPTQQQQSANGSEQIETLHPLSSIMSSAGNNNHYTSLKSNIFNSNSNSLNHATNGSGTQNGSIFANRHFTPGERDTLRLIGQHLRILGLSKTTDMLINESGCMLEHPAASNFSNLIMSGEWDKAEKALNDLKALIDLSADVTKMRFLILEQKYLECLEDGKILEALKCLRDELAPLKHNTDRLHELSGFLMCASLDELKKLSKWDGKNLKSRQSLMDKLRTFVPPNIMLPSKRLEVLITQAMELQSERCPFHNSNEKITLDSWSLLKDHVCTKEQLPCVTLQVLNEHCDEVWFCKFSNDGTKLATGSKDNTLIIWDVNPATHKVTFNKSYDDHLNGVAWVTWSPDDRYLLVCGNDECTELWIWDIEQKVLKKRLNHNHDDSLTSAAWLPCGQFFVTGGTKGQFYYCDLDGNIRETWEGVRVRHLQCLPDGSVLAADTLNRIRAYNFKEMSESNILHEDHQIISFTLNKSNNLALVNLVSQGLHLWDLKDKCLVRRFQGSTQNNFVSFSSFGGANDNFLASGSEDKRIYIWNIKKETPITILEGHSRNVNCVSWNPTVPGMIASVSDDGTVRIWGPTEYLTDSVSVSNSNRRAFNDNNNNISSILANEAASNSNSSSSTTTTTSSSSSSNTTRSDRSTPV